MLSLQAFTFNPFSENTYIWSHPSGECFIIDPGCSNIDEQLELTDYIAENGLKPRAVLLTHAHIDHVLGLDFAVKHFGIKAQMHKLDLATFDACERVAAMYAIPYKHSSQPDFFDGHNLQLGTEKIEVLFVPGHSPGHVALYHAGSDTLVCGDTLFRESIGRTDLPGGDHSTLIRNIRDVLFTLPEDTKIYPGHMEPSTIGHEKKNNPFF